MYFEVVEVFYVFLDLVYFVVIFFLDVMDGLRKFWFLEFLIFFGGVLVGKGS